MRRVILGLVVANEARAALQWRSEAAWLAPHKAQLGAWLAQLPTWGLALFLILAGALFAAVAYLLARELIRAGAFLIRRARALTRS